ncbi:MAG TPA: YceI family protein [Puia sp.]|jgi:polyisoprenoid-binding protein YceI|nr:YceI family protein [Puia sp.]
MAATKWVLDPTHSEVEFKVKHLMISTVTGTFSSFAADVTTEDEDFATAKVTFTVDVASISTNNEQRDGHIKSPDFFDAANYPQMKFVLKKIENVDNDGSYDIQGDLTIRDVTRNVKLAVEFGGVIKDPWGSTRAGLTVSGKINRKEFGLSWHMTTDTGGIVLGDEVRVHVALEFVKA